MVYVPITKKTVLDIEKYRKAAKRTWAQKVLLSD